MVRAWHVTAQQVETNEPAEPEPLVCNHSNCPRHLIPFETQRQRKSHAFAAHGTRTDRKDSISRRGRRMRRDIIDEVTEDLSSRNDVEERQLVIVLGVLGAALAKRGIIIAPQVAATPPPPHPTIRPTLPDDRHGTLPGDEAEHVRRRLIYIVNALAVELQRFPVDILNSMTDHCSRRLHPKGIQRVTCDPDDTFAPPSFALNLTGDRSSRV
jgi:hypothetical protein